MTECPSCGAELEQDARFCPACGAPVPPPERFCWSCGGELATDAQFCARCGSPVEGWQAPAQTGTTTDQAQDAASAATADRPRT